MYEDLDKFKDDIDRIKTRFIEHGPKFIGRLELF